MTSLLSRITSVFKSGTTSFNPYEQRLVEAIRAALPARVRERFAERIASVNLVQRIDGGREVNCFSIIRRKAVLQDATRICDLPGEAILARVTIVGPPGTANIADVWLVGGNLFSIEFSEPTEHADSSQVERIQVLFTEKAMGSWIA